MRMTLAECVRSSVAALLHATGESQTDLAAALGVSQTQMSRRRAGGAAWSLDDCGAVAAYFEIDVLDLMAGPARAAVLAGVRQEVPLSPVEERRALARD
ncbi:helix-turn-helix domain-containing protein [Streptomyces sp. NPDC059866]|uniref:helix-turn-helix domain-containing protein n=1 Tax=Streptomyces sp. NPDC059866 TaxID=3346978 RepID=UPI00366052C6